MKTWLTKRSIPRYAFIVVLLIFTIDRIVIDAYNHWPKAALWGWGMGMAGMLIVLALYLRSPKTNS